VGQRLLRAISVPQASNEPTDATADIYRCLMPIKCALLISDAMKFVGACCWQFPYPRLLSLFAFTKCDEKRSDESH
jgi:hypothetical protein